MEKLMKEGGLPEKPAFNLVPHGIPASWQHRAMQDRRNHLLQNRMYWKKAPKKAVHRWQLAAERRKVAELEARKEDERKKDGVYWKATKYHPAVTMKAPHAREAMLQQVEQAAAKKVQEDARNPDLHIHVDKPATKSMLLPVMVKAVTKAVEKTLAKTARPKAKAKAATWAPLAWAKPEVTVAPVVELEEQVEKAVEKKLAAVTSTQSPVDGAVSSAWRAGEAAAAPLGDTAAPVRASLGLRDHTQQPSLGVVTESPAKKMFSEVEGIFTQGPTLGVVTGVPDLLPGYSTY